MVEGYFKNLYKYTTYETGLEIIKKQTLRFSKPSKFNDPLDCYDGLIEVDESYFPILVRKKFPEASKEEQKEILNNVKQNYKINKDKIRSLYTEERERILISCFSKSPEKLLMWSYYTNSHQGLCFQFFSKGQERFKSFGKVLPLEVNYRSLQEMIKYKDTDPHYLIDWVITKSEKWGDEEEVRWILMDVNLESAYVDIKFPERFLKKVIFGYNMGQKERQNIIDLVKQIFDGSNIAFSEIVIDDTKMDIKEIPYIEPKRDLEPKTPVLSYKKNPPKNIGKVLS